MTKAKDELAKATERGQELSTEEQELEGARERFHADRKDKAARAEFKEAQKRVARVRRAERALREAKGPPPDVIVKRDGTGRVTGWETPQGDTVAAPGGMEG